MLRWRSLYTIYCLTTHYVTVTCIHSGLVWPCAYCDLDFISCETSSYDCLLSSSAGMQKESPSLQSAGRRATGSRLARLPDGAADVRQCHHRQQRRTSAHAQWIHQWVYVYSLTRHFYGRVNLYLNLRFCLRHTKTLSEWEYVCLTFTGTRTGL